MQCFFTVIIFFHIVIRMIVILTNRNDHNLGCILFKTPVCLFSKYRIVVYFVPCTFHTYIIWCVKPTRTVQKCNASLCNIMNLGIQPARSHPRIGIPAVRILPVMLRIRFPCIFHSFRHFTCRNRIPIHFYPSIRLLWRFQNFTVIFNFKTQKGYLMTGILTLKQQ